MISESDGRAIVKSLQENKMFKKVASDVLDLSDIGKIIDPKDYDKVASDDYILHEDGEKFTF